jgi:tRNA(adenine34) deaminase
MDRKSDDFFMGEAYKQALMGYSEREIPVGAVVVAEDRIIARAYNQTERLKDPTAHAEMLVITAATAHLGGKYLMDCTLYVTLEPCSMCAGALYWAQLGSLVFGASDETRGYRKHESPLLHPRTTVRTGCLEKQSSQLISRFFEEIRNQR